MSSTLRLEVNGESREYSGEAVPKSVAQLIETLGLDASMVVAEVNGAIVKRDDLAARALADGDKVEIVRFVGGG